MAAPMRTNQSDSSSTHKFRGKAVNVNKRSVSADDSAFTPNYLLGLDLFHSKRIVEV